MTEAEVGRILQAAMPLADAGHAGPAWRALAPLLRAEGDVVAAAGLAHAIGHPGLEREKRLEHAQKLLVRWPGKPAVVARLGSAAEGLVDHRYLNAAAPDDPFFEALCHALADLVEAMPDDMAVVSALASAARVAGRRWDPTAEQAWRGVLERHPSADAWYNYGLFLKTRGRFSDGLAANRAARAAGGDSEALTWNLGICATGAWEGAVALVEWQRIGCTVALADHGLPEGTWPAVQVRLAERPLAARGADEDDPGNEETVWVERLSPCHGRVQSPTFHDVGADYGDEVLFDGAAITHRAWPGRGDVPVFPQLVTLRRGGWRTFRFAATQAEAGQVAAIEGEGVFLYVHTEQVRTLCQHCWEGAQDAPHEEVSHNAVTGKIVVAPGVPLERVTDLLARHNGVDVCSPKLWDAMGEPGRAAIEALRFRAVVGEG